MSNALQGALFCASIAIVALVVCLIPLAVLAIRRLACMAQACEEVKAKIDLLILDSREMVQSVIELSKQSRTQLSEVDAMLHTVRSWTVRADRLVGGVASVIEPPVFSLVSLSNLVRTGATAFIQSLFHARRAEHPGPAQHPQ